MSGLPVPANQPSFQIATGGVVPRNDNGFPCKIRDYVVNPTNWVNDIPVSNQRTVRGVLAYRNGVWARRCFVCEQGPSQCRGGPCVQMFLLQRQRPWYRAHFEIRQTPSMGLGVFAGTHIAEGQVLDEYHGELIPPRMVAARNDDDYIFGIRGVASSSARDYGNWTRFVNHSCRDFNVEAINDVLGGRRTITFRALRQINRGEQLFIDYGVNYFGDAENYILCTCPAFPDPHVPPKQGKMLPETPQALPRTQAQPDVTHPPDVPMTEQNAWIARHKDWLGKLEPGGYSRWTNVHWRLLEKLIRRRRHYNNWRSNAEYANLPSSRGNSLIKSLVSTERAEMTIHEWHLDVAKVFQQDEVCGKRQGKEWDTNDLLKRIFAVNVAARRRRRLSGRKRSFAKTPPLIQEPVTPKDQNTAIGNLLTPPTTGRQARRASSHRRRRQRRSYSP